MLDIEIDHEAGAIYLRLLPKDTKIEHTKDIQGDMNVLADMTDDGRVYGLSIRTGKHIRWDIHTKLERR